MLSLRDTGRFNGPSDSVVDVASRCHINVPFSISDFIRSDCLEDEKRLRLCVVLFTWTPPNTAPPDFTGKDKGWYESYFLNWENLNGIARFWYKESFGKLKLDGKVLDWTLVQKDPAKVPDKDSSGKSLNQIGRDTAIDIAKAIAISKNESLDAYDGFIAIVNVDKQYVVLGDNSGSGSTFAIGANHNHTCHEVGHIFGNINRVFVHSFGLEGAEYRGGVYGYPYCIMSAETYGNAYKLFTPDTAVKSEPEEANRGPGLCGGTRAMLGWANSIDFDLDDNKEAEFEIQSLGSNQRRPQVVFIKRGDRTFFVEYRSSKDENDRAISQLGFDAIVVVGIVTGGIAAGERGGGQTTNGTFIGQIPLKFIAPPETIINFEPNWGVKVTAIGSNSKVTVKLVRHFAFSLRTYRRTHDIRLSDGSSSFQIDGSPDYSAKCDLYDNVGEWRINEQPVRSIRDLVNS